MAAGDELNGPLERAVSLTNQTVCMEAMGQSVDQSLARLSVILDQCEKNEVHQSIVDQVEAIKIRQYRRQGDIQGALELSGASISQVDYIAQTIRHLPYVADRYLDQDSWNHFVLNHQKLHCGQFRLRTLLGQYEERDYDLLSPHNVADRLYLWVWLWLRDPFSFGVVKIAELLKRMNLDKNIWAVEDIRLVRIALLWLGLFSNVTRQEILSLTAVFPRADLRMPLMDFEELILSYFYELKARNLELAADIAESIRSHELYFSKT